MFQLLIPTLGLLGSVFLLQYHSIDFWMLYVPVTGWAFSVVFEYYAFYFWFTGRRFLGFVLSALLVSGPLYIVSKDLFVANAVVATTDQTATTVQDSLQDEIAQLEKSVKEYEARGWRLDARMAQDRLAEARKGLRQELTPEKPRELLWQRRTVIGMQALGILLLQIGSVLCISDIRRRLEETKDVKNNRQHNQILKTPASENAIFPAEESNSSQEQTPPQVVEITKESFESSNLDDISKKFA